MKFKVTKENHVNLEFYEIGNDDYSELVAAPNLYEAIKEAANPTSGDDITDFLEHTGEDLFIKKLQFSKIKNNKITDIDSNKKIILSKIVENELKDGNLSFIVSTKGFL